MTVTFHDIDIDDPSFYVNDPWPVFKQLRDEDPFHYVPELDVFVVTRHEDIIEIGKRPAEFINSKALFLNDIRYAKSIEEAKAKGEYQDDGTAFVDMFFPKGGEIVATTDQPRHAELRRVLAPTFTKEVRENVSVPLQAYVDELLDAVEPGTTVEWMRFAALVPIFAASRLIGLPDTDIKQIQGWGDQLEKLAAVDITMEEIEAAAAEFQTLQAYIVKNMEEKTANPGPDLLSLLLQQELDDAKVSQANVVTLSMMMLSAASDTTRSLLAGLVNYLAQDPEQWRKLRDDRSLVPNAVEEVLRWVSPARAFVRTAAVDTVVNGQEIKAGQYVYLMYMSANRDERVFPNPDVLDIERKEAKKHLSFGAGIHLCPGTRIVRDEGPIVLDALLDRFSRIELVEEPTQIMNIIHRNGWTSMPVKFHV